MCVSCAPNAGESAICPGRGQPSTEIVRVDECVKCRREHDLRKSCASSARNAGESALYPGPRNPLRRSRVSSTRNAGESAMWPTPAQPSAEIVRVESAKCKRECDCSGARVALYGDRTCRAREMQATRRGVPCARVSGKLEDENWRVQF